MSLDWSIANVADWKALADDPTEAAITQAIVFATMGVGINGISAKNAETFATRVRIYESLFEPSLRLYDEETGEYEDRYITYADVARRIGLTTNAAPESDVAWRKRIMDIAWRENRDAIRSEIRRYEEVSQ